MRSLGKFYNHKYSLQNIDYDMRSLGNGIFRQIMNINIDYDMRSLGKMTNQIELKY